MDYRLLFLCAAGFLGALVDSIAGGGGLVTIPAYLLAGVPPHFTLGTNKFAATMGSFVSTAGYARSSKINFRLLRTAVPLTEEMRKEIQMQCKVTYSAGIAVYYGNNIMEVIDRADKKLYEAKQQGRNRICY